MSATINPDAMNSASSVTDTRLGKHDQQTRIDEISANLTERLKRYHAQRSYFGHLADWYSRLSWWNTLGLGLLCAVIGSMVGFIINPLAFPAAIIGGATALAGYLVVAGSLFQHHRLDKKYKQALLREITNLETVLNEAIVSFSTIDAPMREVLTALEQKNAEKHADVQQFSASVHPIKAQVSTTATTLQALQKNQNLFNENNQSMQKLLTTSNEIHTDLQHEHTALSRINQGLTETQQLLANSVGACTHLSNEVARSTSNLDAIDQQLRNLEIATRTNHLTLVNQITPHPTPTEAASSQRQTSTEDLISAAFAALERFRLITGHETAPNQSDMLPTQPHSTMGAS